MWVLTREPNLKKIFFFLNLKVDAQRALLIATERRRALLLERDRVINGKIKIDANSEPKGTVSFSSISIRLSREYTNNCAHHSSGTSCLFLLRKKNFFLNFFLQQ